MVLALRFHGLSGFCQFYLFSLVLLPHSSNMRTDYDLICIAAAGCWSIGDRFPTKSLWNLWSCHCNWQSASENCNYCLHFENLGGKRLDERDTEMELHAWASISRNLQYLCIEILAHIISSAT